MNLLFWKKDKADQSQEAEWRRWRDACAADASKLADVPEDLLTPKLCMAAMNRDMNGTMAALPEVLLMENRRDPKPWLMDRFCRTEEGRSLLRKTMRHAAGVFGAMAMEGEDAAARKRALKGTESADSPEDVEKAFMCALRRGAALSGIPHSLRSEAVCFAAVMADGRALKDVPEPLKTEAMCLDAVRSCGMALEFVPKDLRSPGLCRIAVESNGLALGFVPFELRTWDMCMAAVQQNGYAVSAVPENLLSKEICLAAVRQCGEAAGGIPKRLRTKELLLEAVRNDWRALNLLPQEMRTAEVCLHCAMQNPDFFEWSWVPEDIRGAVRKAAAAAVPRAPEPRGAGPEAAAPEELEPPRP